MSQTIVFIFKGIEEKEEPRVFANSSVKTENYINLFFSANYCLFVFFDFTLKMIALVELKLSEKLFYTAKCMTFLLLVDMLKLYLW